MALRLSAVLVAALALLLAGSAGGLPGDAYTASSTPSSVQPSSSRAHTVVLTSDGGSASRANRARIQIAAGFTVTEATVTAATSAAGTCTPATWEPDGLLIDAGWINLRSPLGDPNELCPGGILTVTFDATTPTTVGLQT